MTEALKLAIGHLFCTQKIGRLQICTLADNEASKKLAQRCGFELEARLRDYVFHRGASCDILIYALLRRRVTWTAGASQWVWST